jgi:cytochrome c oxidase assembly protein subunit 16
LGYAQSRDCIGCQLLCGAIAYPGSAARDLGRFGDLNNASRQRESGTDNTQPLRYAVAPQRTDIMAVFPRRKFTGTAAANGFGAKYRAAMARHPFLLFGLPFLTVIVAGSFVLTPATAIRYERHDRKVRRMSREEELGLKNNSRKVDMREEYYVGLQLRTAEQHSD